MNTITLPHDLAARREAIRDTVYVWVLANQPDVIQAAMLLVDAGDEDAA
jgi:hypothetical protein